MNNNKYKSSHTENYNLAEFELHPVCIDKLHGGWK